MKGEKSSQGMKLYDRLCEDVRFEEGLKSCMNCGVCTAICPAAEFFDYDPRVLLQDIQSKNEEVIESLLKSDFIWFCGQCMSCKTRCPRGNCPGMVISVLRKVSQELGYFTESKKGRQQYAIFKTTGQNILKYGYCVHPEAVTPELHPEQGPVWEWIFRNRDKLYARLGANLDKDGPGVLRKISPEALSELKSIFDVSGGTELFNIIEKYSREKAEEMGLMGEDGDMSEYFMHLYKD